MKYFFTIIVFVLINAFYIYAGENSRWVISEEGLNMRETPNEKAKKMYTIPFGAEIVFIEEIGEEVSIDDAVGKWSKVKWNNKEGWVFGGFLNNEYQYNFFKLMDKVKKAKKGDIIKISEGKYNVDKANGFILENKENLVLEILDDKKVEFFSNFPDCTIISIINCKNVKIEGLNIYHTVETSCFANCIDITASKNITIKNCDIHGSGFYGIYVAEEETENINIISNVIHNCSYYGLEYNSKNGQILKNIFYDNYDDSNLAINENYKADITIEDNKELFGKELNGKSNESIELTENDLIGYWDYTVEGTEAGFEFNYDSVLVEEYLPGGMFGRWYLKDNIIFIDINDVGQSPEDGEYIEIIHSIEMEIIEYEYNYLKLNRCDDNGASYIIELFKLNNGNESYENEEGYYDEEEFEEEQEEIIGEELKKFSGHSDFIYALDFTHNGKHFISGSNDASVKLWDIETGKEIRTFNGHSYFVCSAQISPDDKYMLTGSGDQKIKLWNINTGEELKIFTGHTSSVFSVCFSPDGKYILSGSFDQTMKLWDIKTGKEIKSFDVLSAVSYVTFTPDGKYALTGAFDNSIKLWNIKTGEIIKTFNGHSDIVIMTKISKNGKYIVSCAKDKMIILWDIKTGKMIKSFTGHSDVVTAACFSPDSKYILSGSWDGTIKLWDIASGNEIKSFLGNSKEIITVNYSHNGKYGLSGGNDNSIKLWDLESAIKNWKK